MYGQRLERARYRLSASGTGTGSGSWDKARCAGGSVLPLRAGVSLLLRHNQWALLASPGSTARSYSRSIFQLGVFYWFVLTETEGVRLLEKKKKEKKSIKGKTQAERGDQWGSPVVEACPCWLYAVNLTLRTAAEGKPASFWVVFFSLPVVW